MRELQDPDGPTQGFTKIRKGFIDFQTSFETTSLNKMVGDGQMGAVVLDEEKDVIFKLTSAADLVDSSAYYFKSYSAEKSWRVLEALETNKGDLQSMKFGVFIHSSAKIGKEAEIGPNCYIGQNVNVGAGTRILNSIVLGGCEIGDHCVIQNAIIGFNSSMGRWCRVEGQSEKHRVAILGVGSILEPEIHIYDCLVLPNKHAFLSYYNQTVL